MTFDITVLKPWPVMVSRKDVRSASGRLTASDHTLCAQIRNGVPSACLRYRPSELTVSGKMFVEVAVAANVIEAVPVAASSQAPTPVAANDSDADPSPNGATAVAESANDADPTAVDAAVAPSGGGGRRCVGSGGRVNRGTARAHSSHTSTEHPIVRESAGAAPIRTTRNPPP